MEGLSLLLAEFCDISSQVLLHLFRLYRFNFLLNMIVSNIIQVLFIYICFTLTKHSPNSIIHVPKYIKTKILGKNFTKFKINKHCEHNKPPKLNLISIIHIKLQHSMYVTQPIIAAFGPFCQRQVCFLFQYVFLLKLFYLCFIVVFKQIPIYIQWFVFMLYMNLKDPCFLPTKILLRLRLG